MLTALDKICVFNGVEVALYFDEAHELYHAIQNDKQVNTLYYV
jgi:hypothetical protein